MTREQQNLRRDKDERILRGEQPPLYQFERQQVEKATFREALKMGLLERIRRERVKQ